jgi:hypothetical protein
MWASDEPQFFLSYEISQDRFLPVLKPHDPLILCFHTRRGGGTDANHLGLSFRGNLFYDVFVVKHGRVS